MMPSGITKSEWVIKFKIKPQAPGITKSQQVKW